MTAEKTRHPNPDIGMSTRWMEDTQKVARIYTNEEASFDRRRPFQRGTNQTGHVNEFQTGYVPISPVIGPVASTVDQMQNCGEHALQQSSPWGNEHGEKMSSSLRQ